MEQKDYNKLLDTFIEGNADTDTNERLRKFFAKSSPNREFEEYSRKKWHASSPEMDPCLKERMGSELLDRILLLEKERRVVRKKQILALCKAAAAILLIAGAGLLGYKIAERSQHPQFFDILAERGQKSTVTLPDGTTVWLNSASKLTYSTDYNSHNRHVTLDGEAYFDVAKNPSLPFVVNAGEVDIEALGTKFNVKAYASDDEIVTTLVDGRVKTSAGSREEILLPNTSANYSRTTHDFRVENVPYADHAIPWIYNELLFDGQSLFEIAIQLERMYNIEIIFAEESISKYTFTGLVRNNSLRNVLDLITSTAPVQYKAYGNTIKFSRRD